MIPKFRVWNKKTESFIDYGDLMLDLKNGKVYAGDVGMPEYTIDVTNQVILMQSTGLKDQNGVEIFEHSELDGAYEVIFKDMRYILRHIRDNDIIDLHDYWRGKNGEIEVTREYTKV